MKNHLRLNSLISLAISAGEISCDSCQLLVQTVISLYANFSVEPLAYDQTHLGSPVRNLAQWPCSSFSPDLLRDVSGETSSFRLRVHGDKAECKAQFNTPGVQCAGFSQSMAVGVRQQDSLVKKFYCLYHTYQTRSHQVCVCQNFLCSHKRVIH